MSEKGEERTNRLDAKAKLSSSSVSLRVRRPFFACSKSLLLLADGLVLFIQFRCRGKSENRASTAADPRIRVSDES
jgi:hypothetical protein